MLTMIIGLILFIGAHSTRIFADGLRMKTIAQRGETIWMGIVAAIALIGFILIISGYGQARIESVLLWSPPIWTKHLAALLTLPAFIFIVAAYLPGTRLKAKIGHPMIVGVKLWAFAHLMSNGMLADIILFGSFLIWAILDFGASRKRDKVNAITHASVSLTRDIYAIVIGVVVWAMFAGFLHGILIGVKPFG